MQKTDAIVFIKKDSERLPGKNFRDFNGQPLFAIILQTLDSHPLIEKILVDSDSNEVLDFVRCVIKKGVAIHRPPELRGCQVSANDLIAYDISFSTNNHFFQTHCTNPLLTAGTITKAIEMYFNSLPNHDSLFSTIKIKNRFFDKNGNPTNHTKGKLLRLQDLQPVFMENASFFIFSAASFANSGKDRVGLKPLLYPISQLEGTDIDYEDDFLLAELLYRNKDIFPHIFG